MIAINIDINIAITVTVPRNHTHLAPALQELYAEVVDRHGYGARLRGGQPSDIKVAMGDGVIAVDIPLENAGNIETVVFRDKLRKETEDLFQDAVVLNIKIAER